MARRISESANQFNRQANSDNRLIQRKVSCMTRVTGRQNKKLVDRLVLA